MKVEVREVSSFVITEERCRWLQDEDIERYIGFSEKVELGRVQDLDPKNEKHFEIYVDDKHVGDVRFKYNSAYFRNHKYAEFFVIIGLRNAGLGSLIFPKLIEEAKKHYKQIYCFVHKSNIRSVRLMKKNGFYIDEMMESNFLLKLDLL